MANGMTITEAGRELLTLALKGKELHFSRGAVGDGLLSSDSEIYTLSGLKNERKSLPIQSMRTSRTGTCEIVLNITNTGQTTGFWLREYGLFAQHPDTGQEILYAYCNKGTEAGYLEGYDGANPISFGLTLITVIDQAPNITATITVENNYVTVRNLETRIYDLFSDSSDIAGVWIYGQNTSGRLSPVSWSTFKQLLWGITDVGALNSRIERLEDNLGDILLQLEMQSIYPDYSHYIIEDFKDPDQIDTFSCKITGIIAGDDSIDCNTASGIYPGSWYTVTDGINAENVQVKSVNIENGIQRIILAEPINNTYTLENCKMYRSSAGITTQGASGSGVRKAIYWRPDLVWQGFSANSAQTAIIDMSTGNSRSYSLSGRCAVTGQGTLTLSF